LNKLELIDAFKKDSEDGINGWSAKILSFIMGALLLCLFSTLQKMAIGAPLILAGYLVPALFGGITGFLITVWNAKLRNAHKMLQKTNDDLKIMVRERNENYEKTLAELRKNEERDRFIFFKSPIAIEIY